MHRARSTRAALEPGRPASSCYAPAEAVDLVKELATRQVRRDGRARRPPRGRPPQGRPDRPRHAVAARRAPAGPPGWRSSPPGDAAAEARAAGADVVGADDLVAKVDGGFLDFDVAIATPDLMGQVGHARPGPRAPWPHAQPQDRHRHHRRRQGRDRVQGRPGRVPHRQGRATSTSGSARRRFTREQLLPTPRRHRRAPCGPSRPRPRAATSGRSRVSSTMGPGVHIDPARARQVDEELAASRLESASPGRSTILRRPARGRSHDTIEH